MVLVMTKAIAVATVFVFVSGCGSKVAETKQPPESAGSTAEKGNERRANLQIVLEGPLAICVAPDNKSDKMVILIPKAKGHFEPGLSADTNESPLCESDCVLDFDKSDHKNRLTKYEDKGWDKVGSDCLQKTPGYLSLVVDKPDRILPMQSTTATITSASSPNSNAGEKDYASQTLLYYNEVLLSGISVKRYKTGTNGTSTTTVTKDECKITVKGPLGIKMKQDLDFSAWQPAFHDLGSDVRLTFGSTPSEMDDTTHTHAKGAYAGIAHMLGVDRVVRFPKPDEFHIGPHNDCRAPQMLVLPLEAIR